MWINLNGDGSQYEEYQVQDTEEDRRIRLEKLTDQLIVTSELLIEDGSMVSKNDKKYVFEGIVYD